MLGSCANSCANITAIFNVMFNFLIPHTMNTDGEQYVCINGFSNDKIPINCNKLTPTKSLYNDCSKNAVVTIFNGPVKYDVKDPSVVFFFSVKIVFSKQLIYYEILAVQNLKVI